MTKVTSKNEVPLRTQSRKPITSPLVVCKALTATDLTPLQLWRLQRVVVYIDDHLANHVTLMELSEAAGYSPMHFAGQFRMATGMRPHDYVLRRKVEEAQLLLLTSDMPIVDVALSFGFLSQAHFTTVFKRFVGTPPLRWQHVRRRQIQSAFFRLRKLSREALSEARSDLPVPAFEWSSLADGRNKYAEDMPAG
jgi:AraC-like DNA-binding protein